MSFFTVQEKGINYAKIFKPLGNQSSAESISVRTVPYYGQDKLQQLNILVCILNSNRILRKKRQPLVEAQHKLEQMLFKKYPEEFWNAQNIHDLAVCLLAKENWKLHLCDILNYQN